MVDGERVEGLFLSGYRRVTGFCFFFTLLISSFHPLFHPNFFVFKIATYE